MAHSQEAKALVDDLRVVLPTALDHCRCLESSDQRGILLEVILRVAQQVGIYDEILDEHLAELIG